MKDRTNGETPFGRMLRQRREERQQPSPPSSPPSRLQSNRTLSSIPPVPASFLPSIHSSSCHSSPGVAAESSAGSVEGVPRAASHTRSSTEGTSTNHLGNSSNRYPFRDLSSGAGGSDTAAAGRSSSSRAGSDAGNVRAKAITQSASAVTRNALTLTTRTPPHELLAVVQDLKTELDHRTNGVNAIQRNFERLSDLYRRDQAELARVTEELRSLREVQKTMDSESRVSGALYAELQTALSVAEARQATLEKLQEEKRKHDQWYAEADETIKALVHEKKQLAMESQSMMARLSDVEEALADTQRELADVVGHQRERRAASSAAMRTFLKGLSDALSLLHDAVPPPQVRTTATTHQANGLSVSEGNSHAGEEDPWIDDDSYLVEEVLERRVIPAVTAWRARVVQARASDEDAVRTLQVVALVDAEEAARRATMDAEQMMWSCEMNALTAARGLEANCLARVLGEQETLRRAREAAQHRHEDRLAKQREDSAAQVARLTQELTEVRALMAREARAENESTEAELHALRTALQFQQESHERELEEQRREYDTRFSQLEASTSEASRAHAVEMASLEAIIAKYTHQLERQSELFEGLKRQAGDSAAALVEEDVQKRALVEAHERAIRDLRAELTARHQRHTQALLTLLSQERDERVLLVANEEEKERALLWSHGVSMLVKHTREVVAADARHMIDMLRNRAAMDVRTMYILASEESSGRLQLVTDTQRVFFTLLEEHCIAQTAIAVAAAEASVDAAQKQELNALRKAGERRQERFSAQLSDLHLQLRRLEEEGAAERMRRDEAEAALAESRLALARKEENVANEQRAIMGAVQRVLTAEEASESAYSCGSCFQLLKRPRTCVPCGHSFCEACLLTHPRNADLAQFVGKSAAASSATAAAAADVCLRFDRPLLCPECDLHHVTAAVATRALELLGGKFHYRRQVLTEIIRSYQPAPS